MCAVWALGVRCLSLQPRLTDQPHGSGQGGAKPLDPVLRVPEIRGRPADHGRVGGSEPVLPQLLVPEDVLGRASRWIRPAVLDPPVELTDHASTRPPEVDAADEALGIGEDRLSLRRRDAVLVHDDGAPRLTWALRLRRRELAAQAHLSLIHISEPTRLGM